MRRAEKRKRGLTDGALVAAVGEWHVTAVGALEAAVSENDHGRGAHIKIIMKQEKEKWL